VSPSKKRALRKQESEFQPPQEALKGKDTSLYVHQREKLSWDLNIRERNDYTERQTTILDAVLERSTRCVMIDGVWGTGKTHLVILAALKLLNSGRVSSLIYVRNPIEASANSRLGYLGGSIDEKMAPYNAVLKEKLDELLPAGDVAKLMKEHRIECIPTGFLQGRSFNCTAIVVDEAASMSWEDLMLLLSRCGEFTRIFMVGDTINQLYLKGESGFARLCQAFDDEESRNNGVYVFELKEARDICRSGFVRFIMRKAGIIKDHPIDGQASAVPMFPSHDPLRRPRGVG
jgi:predicted ribonuclease YlaK